MNNLLTAKQVIDLLRIDRTTLYRMLRDGRIKGVKVGSQWRFPKNDIDCLLIPQDGTSGSGSHDILPLHCLQPIQEVFSDMIQVSAVTTDMDGVPISKFSNPCSFCELIQSTKKGRLACMHSWKTIQFEQGAEGKFAVCHAGLNYTGANIVMDNKKVAKIIAGQFYEAKQDPEKEKMRIRKLAKNFGIEESKLLKASKNITIIDARIAAFLGKWLQKVAVSFATLGNERRAFMRRLKNIEELSKL